MNDKKPLEIKPKGKEKSIKDVSLGEKTESE